MEVMSIADPYNIQQVGWLNPWDCHLGQAQWLTSPGHTNQLFHDASTELLFLSGGGLELVVMDVSDPAQPVLCGGYGIDGNSLGTWGVDLFGSQIALTYINTLGIPFAGTWSGIKTLSWQVLAGVEDQNASEIFLEVGPNPFSSQSTIRFDLEGAENLRIDLMDAKGKTIAVLRDQKYGPGIHRFEIDGELMGLSSGMYFLRLSANGKQSVRRLLFSN